ncbi:cysteine synthase A [Christensenellaceae bacterium OttesenSCG-928-K19]|nr:cysteine synthase A [Christensenellaceae bacterium OttesenSCG-928-K19]
MATIEKLTELIGKTPIMNLKAMHENIYAKLEYRNPLGSVKDRAALYMIRAAMEHGGVTKDTVIVESTSGNTGIALSFICTSMGMKLVLTMPESMSVERRKLLAALGAELVLTPVAEGMRGAISKAQEICRERKGYMTNQFENPANVQAHKETTGPEIWQDMDGNVDILVAGVGSGGTISGAGEYLKSQKPDIKIVAVEPAESPVLSGGKPAPHKIQGIGAGFVPKILNRDIIDEVVTVSADQAKQTARQLGRTEGLLCGISSGAALCAAVELAGRPENAGKKIVVVLPDTGERYLSTDLFD